MLRIYDEGYSGSCGRVASGQSAAPVVFGVDERRRCPCGVLFHGGTEHRAVSMYCVNFCLFVYVCNRLLCV